MRHGALQGMVGSSLAPSHPGRESSWKIKRASEWIEWSSCLNANGRLGIVDSWLEKRQIHDAELTAGMSNLMSSGCFRHSMQTWQHLHIVECKSDVKG